MRKILSLLMAISLLALMQAPPSRAQTAAEAGAVAAAQKLRQVNLTEDPTDAEALFFQDDATGFAVKVPKGFTAYPRGANPIAILRAEDSTNGARLAIDAANVGQGSALMPFQIEEFYSDLLKTAKNSVKNSANDKKIMESGMVDLGERSAAHILTSNLTVDGKSRIVRDEYAIVTPTRLFLVTYIVPEKAYEPYRWLLPRLMQSVKIEKVWKKVSAPGTQYSCEIPGSCIDLTDPDEASRGTAVYGNADLMVGLVAEKRAENYSFIPASIGTASESEKSAALKALEDKIKKDTENVAKDFKGQFTSLSGTPCVKMEYEVQGLYNEEYYFVKGDDLIEIGLVYHPEKKDSLREDIEHVISTISL